MKALVDLFTQLARDKFCYRGRVVHRASTDANYLIDNPHRRCPVIAKARNDLGYDHRVPLEEGLMRSLIWYSENREAEES
jgi:nucleoside-diphosphate-sugar epimerase